MSHLVQELRWLVAIVVDLRDRVETLEAARPGRRVRPEAEAAIDRFVTDVS